MKIKRLLKNVLFVTLSAGIAGCAQISNVTTNLGKKNFDNYFSASAVTILESENELPAKHKLIGLVEGQDCQLKPHLAAPDDINARTNARKAAFEKGANAVIFTGCADIESKACTGLKVCYAKAYQVENN